MVVELPQETKGLYPKGTMFSFDGVAQHLYFISEDEIDDGPYMRMTGRKFVARRKCCDACKKYTNDMKDIYKKVIASTDASLELPLIPQSFMQQYVAANGKIDKVQLMLNHRLHGCVYKDAVEHQEVTDFNKTLKLTANNEVVVSHDKMPEVTGDRLYLSSEPKCATFIRCFEVANLCDDCKGTGMCKVVTAVEKAYKQESLFTEEDMRNAWNAALFVDRTNFNDWFSKYKK